LPKYQSGYGLKDGVVVFIDVGITRVPDEQKKKDM
jgi:hypothetical protein